MVERGKNTNDVEVAAEYCTTYPKLPLDAWEKNANCTLGAADKKEEKKKKNQEEEEEGVTVLPPAVTQRAEGNSSWMTSVFSLM